MKTLDKRKCRPRDILAAFTRGYPNAWQLTNDLRMACANPGGPRWADWCYLPMAASYAVVSNELGVRSLNIDQVGDVAVHNALAAWRLTQGIYRFDADVYEAVRDTPISGDIPHEILFRLPEWCIYIETPGITITDAEIAGVFVHLEHDAKNGRKELRLLLDPIGGHPLAIPLHLGPWPLAQSIHAMLTEALKHTDQAGDDAQPFVDAIVDGRGASLLAPALAPIISLVLYICTQSSEIGDGTRQPRNPEPKRTKRGLQMFPADKPTTWDVGVRLGSALRRAYQQHGHDVSGDGDGQVVRAHIRRAHWHGFRSGPRKRADGSDIPATDRPFDLKWLPPIAVNLTDLSEMPAVIRPVR